jgi:hypothetical protein
MRRKKLRKENEKEQGNKGWIETGRRGQRKENEDSERDNIGHIIYFQQFRSSIKYNSTNSR